MMVRLYCADRNMFVDPTDRNVLVWYQHHRVDDTIGILRTELMYETMKSLPAEKYWDAERGKIRYKKAKKVFVPGRYQLYQIPWSGMYDCNSKPIFHGDILESEDRTHLVFDVTTHGTKLLNCSSGSCWVLERMELRIVASAILSPHLVSESIRSLFIYPSPEE